MIPRPRARSDLPCDGSELTRRVRPRHIPSTVRRFSYGVMYGSVSTRTRRRSALSEPYLETYYSWLVVRWNEEQIGAVVHLLGGLPLLWELQR